MHSDKNTSIFVAVGVTILHTLYTLWQSNIAMEDNLLNIQISKFPKLS